MTGMLSLWESMVQECPMSAPSLGAGPWGSRKDKQVHYNCLVFSCVAAQRSHEVRTTLKGRTRHAQTVTVIMPLGLLLLIVESIAHMFCYVSFFSSGTQ